MALDDPHPVELLEASWRHVGASMAKPVIGRQLADRRRKFFSGASEQSVTTVGDEI